MEANILDKFSDKKAIVLEAFGPGNIPFDYSNWIEKIREFSTKNILIFVTTQNSFGEVDMEKYEVGKKALDAGALSCKDMILETVLVKLMWIYGNYPNYNTDQIKKLFYENICGEFRK